MKRQFVAGISLVALMVAATAVILSAHTKEARAHCQVPCGIYDDPARIARLAEDTTTIATIFPAFID